MTLGGGEDVYQRKKVLAEKLAKEQANLSFLQDSLTKSEQLTQNMLGILSSFDSRLSKLETNILPVHRETVDLQRRQKNIDKVLRGLDNVISYHNVASSEDQDIRDGPGADVDSYLQCLGKVQDAVGFFERNNPNSPELSLLTSLMETGREQMERSFRSLLTRNSSPVAAETILAKLSASEDSPEGDVEPSLKQIDDEVIDDLSKIATWLVQETKSSDFMNVYAQIRSNMLSRTLQGLIEAYSQGKLESYSPANITVNTKIKYSTGGSTPLRKSTVKRKEIRRVPSKTYDSFYGLGGSRKMVSAPQAFDSPGLKEEEDEIEAGRFITLCGALLKLLQSEQSLISAIIPQSHCCDIFDVLIQSSMETVVADGQGMEASARKLIAKREYFSLLPLLPVLKYLGSVLIKFSVVLQGVRQVTQGTITSLFSALEVVGAKALEDFTENIKHDPDKQSNMPKDGTVHELTSNTLIFLEHLLGYTDTVGNMLNSQDQVLDPITKEVESPKRTVAKYISRVLAALGLNLELKSKSYVHITGQVALSGIFLMNNYNYILKGLQRTGVLSLMKEGGFTEIEDQYGQHIQEQKLAYQKGWSKVMNYLLEMDKPLTHHKDAKVGQKHKQLIKDKFKGFNSEFEEICQIQKTYAVPDQLLRDQLRKENIDLIVPNYRTFQEKYKAVQFSKNMEKYVKYTPEEVEKELSTLFDLSA